MVITTMACTSPQAIALLGFAGWIEVQWDHGGANSYRMGAEGKYDLHLADDSQTPPTTSTSGEGSDGEVTTPTPPSSQPTSSRLAAFLQALGEEASSASAERLREEIERLEQEAGMVDRMVDGDEVMVVGEVMLVGQQGDEVIVVGQQVVR